MSSAGDSSLLPETNGIDLLIQWKKDGSRHYVDSEDVWFFKKNPLRKGTNVKMKDERGRWWAGKVLQVIHRTSSDDADSVNTVPSCASVQNDVMDPDDMPLKHLVHNGDADWDNMDASFASVQNDVSDPDDDIPLKHLVHNEMTGNEHHKSCMHTNCREDIFAACVLCMSLLCAKHFMEDDPCENHIELLNDPTLALIVEAIHSEMQVGGDHMDASTPAPNGHNMDASTPAPNGHNMDASTPAPNDHNMDASTPAPNGHNMDASTPTPNGHNMDASTPAPNGHNMDASTPAPNDHNMDASTPAPNGHNMDASTPAPNGHNMDGSTPAPNGHNMDASTPAPNGHNMDASTPAPNGHNMDASTPAPNGHNMDASTPAPNGHNMDASTPAPNGHNMDASTPAPNGHNMDASQTDGGDMEASSASTPGSDGDGTRSTKPRKRKSTPSDWQRNVNKTLRNSGEAYVSASGKQITKRQPGPPCHSCKFECNRTFSIEARDELCRTYWQTGDFNRRDFLRMHVQNEKILQLQFSSEGR
ncbi:collagen alpha-1(III) chain isoform X1 [Strongylocentrotus purpuratus]|uniref:Uncharacterized protein n=2 Tax=Strongylocentrotus purpuratus TaxID=7668 RepID=A0A7M7LWI8_STRPU|nr:collagen alpha-1(III) chain isoform X1 [Strongylocentrotus purpuratus]